MLDNREDFTAHVKALIFVLFLVGCFSAYLLTPVNKYLDPQTIRDLASGHNTSPFIFILLYGFGITMFLPASFFTAVGALLFGFSWGLFYNFAGAMLGASMSFWIGRYLGRDFAATIVGGRLEKYDHRITANGFKSTLYLRLIFFPFTPLNFGMGLTGVTFSQFFWGTFFGKIASGVILTFFFATLSEVWISGHWSTLFNWQSILAVILFMASFYIPKIAQQLFPEKSVQQSG